MKFKEIIISLVVPLSLILILHLAEKNVVHSYLITTFSQYPLFLFLGSPNSLNRLSNVHICLTLSYVIYHIIYNRKYDHASFVDPSLY